MSTVVRIGRAMVWLSLIICAISLAALAISAVASTTAFITLISIIGLAAGFLGLFFGGALLALTDHTHANKRADS